MFSLCLNTEVFSLCPKTEVFSLCLKTEVFSLWLNTEVFSLCLNTEVFSLWLNTEVFSLCLKTEVFALCRKTEVFSLWLSTEVFSLCLRAYNSEISCFRLVISSWSHSFAGCGCNSSTLVCMRDKSGFLWRLGLVHFDLCEEITLYCVIESGFVGVRVKAPDCFLAQLSQVERHPLWASLLVHFFFWFGPPSPPPLPFLCARTKRCVGQ